MNLDEYAKQQQSITAQIVALIRLIMLPFRRTPVGDREWAQIVVGLYPIVERGRTQSAEIARRFYDAERIRQTQDRTRQPVLRAGYQRPWFVEAMRPVRDAFRRAQGSNDGAMVQLEMAVAKEVENGGRRTLLNAVRSHQDVKGWARVATGNETCAFCLMLVSRGPVYFSAEDAGLNLDDEAAIELAENYLSAREANRQVPSADNFSRLEQYTKDMQENMVDWHTGCDCKVVPVWDKARWPGRDEFQRAEDLWERITKGYKGRDALNALRRYVERGADFDMNEYAAAA